MAPLADTRYPKGWSRRLDRRGATLQQTPAFHPAVKTPLMWVISHVLCRKMAISLMFFDKRL
jgi:hypothetical protein